MIDRKEVKAMLIHDHLALAQAHEIQEREIERAARERRYSNPRPSIRRSVGRRLMGVGLGIAA
jgi:hypothetical protein